MVTSCNDAVRPAEDLHRNLFCDDKRKKLYRTVDLSKSRTAEREKWVTVVFAHVIRF